MKLKPEVVEAYAALGITEEEALCMTVNLTNEVVSLGATLNGITNQIEVLTAQRAAVQIEYDELSSGVAKMLEPSAPVPPPVEE